MARHDRPEEDKEYKDWTRQSCASSGGQPMSRKRNVRDEHFRVSHFIGDKENNVVEK